MVDINKKLKAKHVGNVLKKAAVKTGDGLVLSGKKIDAIGKETVVKTDQAFTNGRANNNDGNNKSRQTIETETETESVSVVSLLAERNSGSSTTPSSESSTNSASSSSSSSSSTSNVDEINSANSSSYNSRVDTSHTAVLKKRHDNNNNSELPKEAEYSLIAVGAFIVLGYLILSAATDDYE